VLFVMIWRSTMLTAAIAVIIDHRAAIRDMQLGFRSVLRRWITYSLLAEKLVVRPVTRMEKAPHGARQF